MQLHELYPFEVERKDKKRLGRGSATGRGCTAGKGNKGQNARAGGGVQPWFEGGQMPLQRRIPKRGFKNRFRVQYKIFNLEQISNLFPNKTRIGLEDFYTRKLAKPSESVKILGQGELDKGIEITAHRFSKTAAQKISDAGGTPKQVEG
ncbi:MAG: 50S ribosomal protein L15 [Desulfonatronovibrionaceae bacterium]